jgi:hypothetical protein
MTDTTPHSDSELSKLLDRNEHIKERRKQLISIIPVESDFLAVSAAVEKKLVEEFGEPIYLEAALIQWADRRAEKLVGEAQEDVLEDFRSFVFNRHYDGTWDGQGATINGTIDTELREYAALTATKEGG